MMPDDDAVSPAGVNLLGAAADDARGWRCHRDDSAVTHFIGAHGPGAHSDGQYVRLARPGALLDQRSKTFGEAACIQSVFDPDRPALMEIVKQPGGHATPVVKWLAIAYLPLTSSALHLHPIIGISMWFLD